jgi:uncharacterized surface protein with fasciclin (FAS1) repeats
MTVLDSRRVSVVLGFLGSLVQMGCSDDDTALDGPTIHADAGSSSSPHVTSSGPSSSSSGNEAGVLDGGATSAATSSVAEPATDAGTDAAVADADAGELAVVGLLEGLSDDPETTTFAELIVRAQMQEDLDKEGPFTVLAPINSGFERLPEGYLASLSRKQVETLVRNHLIFEPQSSNELVAAETFLSVLDLPHQISATDGEIYVDGLTRVTARNKSFRNDTVHKVDSVLTVQVFPGTLAEAVHAYPRLSELESHLTEQDRALLEQDDKTLFAPINGGFEELMVADLADAGDGGVTAAMSYHVLPQKVPSAGLGGSGVTKSALGPYLGLSSSTGLAIHDGHRVSHVVVADLQVQSGEDGSVLHVVDAALVAPPTVDEVLAESFNGETFAKLLGHMGETTVPGGADSFSTHLANTDGVTVFAPSDAAFDRIAGTFGSRLAKVLGFHVIDEVVDSTRLLDSTDQVPATLTNSPVETFTVVRVGGPADTTLLLDGMAMLTIRDIPAANGVVHAIDGVLVPQDVTFPGTTEQALAAYPALSKVSAAVTQTGLLDDVLSTLFAPYDIAFGEVGSATAFVEAHTVSPGVRDRLSLEGAQVFTTLSGDPIDVDDESLKFGHVQIIRPDLLTQSGVVHVVDRELESASGDAGVDAGD